VEIVGEEPFLRRFPPCERQEEHNSALSTGSFWHNALNSSGVDLSTRFAMVTALC
jgi:hypothetical protein